MIRDGMWFEDEAHYQHYLKQMKRVRPAWERLQRAIFNPLIKRMKETLKNQEAKKAKK